MKAGEFSAETVDLIWERDRGCCVDCGMPQVRERRGEAFGGWSLQHREARGQGGTKRGGRPWLTLPSNGVVLCGTGVTGCHGRTETVDRARAFALGFAIRSGIRRPHEIPMRHALLGWVTLNDAGGWDPADAPECGAAHPYAGRPCTRILGHDGSHGNDERAWLASQPGGEVAA